MSAEKRDVVCGTLGLMVLKMLRNFLYGLRPSDPVSYLAVAVILAVASFLATCFPGRKAIRVDPALTLKCE